MLSVFHVASVSELLEQPAAKCMRKKDYVYEHLVVKRKGDELGCLVSLMEIITEVTSLRQTMWCYDSDHSSVPALWGAASSPNLVKRRLLLQHMRVSAQMPTDFSLQKRMPAIIKAVNHDGLIEVCCWNMLLKSCTVYRLVAGPSTVPTELLFMLIKPVCCTLSWMHRSSCCDLFTKINGLIAKATAHRAE